MDEQKICKINEVVKDYFSNNPSVDKIQAKDLMPEFIKAGIFTADHRNGLPIRKLLRDLDKANRLDKVPNILPERKAKNTNWYFVKR